MDVPERDTSPPPDADSFASPPRGSNGRSHRPRREGEREELAGLWRAVRADLVGIAREAGAIARLRWARVGLAVRERAHGLVFALFGALAAVAVTLVGAIVFVLGLAGGLSALFGGMAWAGRLSAGLLILAGGAAALLFLRERMRRRFLEALEERFGPAEETPAPGAVRSEAR